MQTLLNIDAIGSGVEPDFSTRGTLNAAGGGKSLLQQALEGLGFGPGGIQF